jgi:hypothetical protein
MQARADRHGRQRNELGLQRLVAPDAQVSLQAWNALDGVPGFWQIAYFNPASSSFSASTFFWCSATASLKGCTRSRNFW